MVEYNIMHYKPDIFNYLMNKVGHKMSRYKTLTYMNTNYESDYYIHDFDKSSDFFPFIIFAADRLTQPIKTTLTEYLGVDQ